MLISRYTLTDIGNAGDRKVLALRHLDGGDLMCFEAAGTPPEGAHSYERVTEVVGEWQKPAPFAVFAEWQVDDPASYAAFEASRQRLFEVRREHLPTFAFDWLLKSRDVEGRYLVLGLYGDEEGAARLCRLHPEIQRFAQAHPAARYSARDISGLQVCRVERFTL